MRALSEIIFLSAFVWVSKGLFFRVMKYIYVYIYQSEGFIVHRTDTNMSCLMVDFCGNLNAYTIDIHWTKRRLSFVLVDILSLWGENNQKDYNETICN